MSTPNNTSIVLNKNERPSLFVNALELGFAMLVGIVTWFWLRSYLRTALPFPCDSSVNHVLIECGWTEAQAWESLGHPLFSKYAVPLALFLAISGIFLVRSVRKDVRHFSTISNLAFLFPIFAFLSFFIFSIFSLICFPLGIVLAIFATVFSDETDKYKWEWVSLPFNLTWLIIFGMFISQFLSSYGD